MTGPEEEDRFDDMDSSRPRVCDEDGDGKTRKDDDDESSDNSLTHYPTLESVCDPVGPVISSYRSTVPRILTALGFSCSISSDTVDLDISKIASSFHNFPKFLLGWQ